jgi:1,4-dihydroxy-2-naphthoyl-CoA hydrolase
MSLEHLFVVPFDESFDAVYGLEYVDPARGRVTVGERHRGAHGAVHSGVYAAIAESLASTATAVEMAPQGYMVSGLSNSTHVLADVRDGVLEGAARCRARSDGEWLWEVEIRAGETVAAIGTVVIALRPLRR